MATVRTGLVAGHPFATGEGGMECCGRSQAGSIRYLDHATGRWGSDQPRPRVLAASRRYSRRSGQATDVPVAQPVVDQGEQLARGGDLADVRAAVLADAGPSMADRADRKSTRLNSSHVEIS